MVVKVGNDVISALDHLARCFRETRLVTIDQRQAPGSGQVKKNRAEKQKNRIAYCGFQVRAQNSAR
jgi:hypothetical protein